MQYGVQEANKMSYTAAQSELSGIADMLSMQVARLLCVAARVTRVKLCE